MVKMMSEETVKKTLGIDSFRNLSKEKIVEFVSMIPNMDKDLAVSIINQFPSFCEATTTILEHLMIVCKSGLDTNNKNQQMISESCTMIINSLGELVLREDLSSED